jgi:hypothetical protein
MIEQHKNNLMNIHLLMNIDNPHQPMIHAWTSPAGNHVVFRLQDTNACMLVSLFSNSQHS